MGPRTCPACALLGPARCSCAAPIGNTTLTMAVVLQVSPADADWVALGMSTEGVGMKGMDVAMLWLPTDSTAQGVRAQVGSPLTPRAQYPCASPLKLWAVT